MSVFYFKDIGTTFNLIRPQHLLAICYILTKSSIIKVNEKNVQILHIMKCIFVTQSALYLSEGFMAGIHANILLITCHSCTAFPKPY